MKPLVVSPEKKYKVSVDKWVIWVYDKTMIVTYDLEDDPKFEYGQEVSVDLSKLTGESQGFVYSNKNILGSGKIVGCAGGSLIKLWLVDFGQNFSDTYPYHVVSIPHIFIVYC